MALRIQKLIFDVVGTQGPDTLQYTPFVSKTLGHRTYEKLIFTSGMCNKNSNFFNMLQGKEGRKPLKDKDLKSLVPVEPLTPGSSPATHAGQHTHHVAKMTSLIQSNCKLII